MYPDTPFLVVSALDIEIYEEFMIKNLTYSGCAGKAF